MSDPLKISSVHCLATVVRLNPLVPLHGLRQDTCDRHDCSVTQTGGERIVDDRRDPGSLALFRPEQFQNSTNRNSPVGTVGQSPRRQNLGLTIATESPASSESAAASSASTNEGATQSVRLQRRQAPSGALRRQVLEPRARDAARRRRPGSQRQRWTSCHNGSPRAIPAN